MEPDEVHLWRFGLDRERAEIDRLAENLSEDERDRAARFREGSIRDRFVVARGRLREILGPYLGEPPAALSFVYGSRGKPALRGGEGDRSLAFNLAHSAGQALVGVTRDRRIGVDLEEARALSDLDRMIERCFSEPERRRFEGLAEAEKIEAFFRGWTRKEAYLKATGEGLGTPLHQVEVAIGVDEPPAILRAPDEARRWTLIDLKAEVEPGFAGALVVEGPVSRLRVFPG